MKRKLLSLSLLTLLSGVSYAQDNNQALIDYLNADQERKEQLYNQKQAKGGSKETPIYNINNLADISEQYAYFYEPTDIRGNAASNADVLQNGFAGFQLNGEGMEVTIYDGGKINATHRDFVISEGSRIVDLENGAQPVHSHATSVAGLLGGNGAGFILGVRGLSTGVLPNAVIKHAGFSTTVNGNVYNKIVQYDEKISNHSYGVNPGWGYKNAQEGPLGAGYYFSSNSNLFENEAQTVFGAYLGNDYNYDVIVSQNPDLTIVKSSGNYYGSHPSESPNLPIFRSTGGSTFVPYAEGELIPLANCHTGAYCIGTGSLAKNIIVVGAVDIPQTEGYKITSSDQIVRSSYSSVGPRKDGAIKPDVVAVGTSLYSPISTNNISYTSGSGTSFSAPKVTGIIGQITQLKRNLINDNQFYYFADETKALIIHSAMEAGDHDGPDNWFGWGMVDAKKAAELVLSTNNNEDFFERNVKVSGVDYEKIVSAKNDEELKVTITWLDPASTYTASYPGLLNDTSSKLINDLDLRIIDTETNEVYFPWKLDLANVTGAAVKGDNTVDNVEQVVIKNPVAGRNYKIVVSNKGNLVAPNRVTRADQTYVLLTTGAAEQNLSTTDVTAQKGVSIYPTIAQEVVNVKSTAPVVKAEVIDMSGRVVASSKKEVVNVSSLSTGVYIINITTADGVVTSKKFVKQ